MKRTLLVALVLATSLVLPAGYLLSPAQAAACSGTSGVTVVVQFPDHTETACAAGDPASGFEALERAGFTVTRVSKFPGAVCRIDGVPTSDPCVNMPPADAYWTYFHAQPGGTWTSSNVGADGYNPKPGSVEGWRFGDGDEPSTPPPGAAPTPKPSTTPKPAPSASGQPTTSEPSTSSTPSSMVAAQGSTPGSTPGSTATGTPTASPSATGISTATADTSATPTGITSENGPVVEESDEPAPASGGASWVWGVGLLAVLVAVGGAVAYRRRS